MSNLLNKLKNKNFISIVFKLLHDSLFILLIFFVIALIAEGLLTGIIASHFGLYKIAILVILNIAAILGLQKYIIGFHENTLNKKTAWSLLLIMGLLVFNSLLKLNILLNLSILVLLSITSYLIFKTLQEPEL